MFGYLLKENRKRSLLSVWFYWREFVQTNRQALLSILQLVRGSEYKENAVAMRDGLKDYVNSEKGSVSRQWDYVKRT